jgi:hypothetical protein
VFGTKKIKKDIEMLKDGIEKCEDIGKIFKHFTKTEWIFDNTEAQ